MSTPSIAAYLPFGRVRIEDQRVQADPAVAVVRARPPVRAPLRPVQRRARRVHSCYRRWVRDLSLGAHRLRLRVRRLWCHRCEGVRLEGFKFVAPYARVTRRMARYIADLCRILSVAEVAAHLGLDWELVKACDKAVLREEVGATDTSGLRLLAVDEIALLRCHDYTTVVLNVETGRVVWMGKDRTSATLGPSSS